MSNSYDDTHTNELEEGCMEVTPPISNDTARSYPFLSHRPSGSPCLHEALTITQSDRIESLERQENWLSLIFKQAFPCNLVVISARKNSNKSSVAMDSYKGIFCGGRESR